MPCVGKGELFFTHEDQRSLHGWKDGEIPPEDPNFDSTNFLFMRQADSFSEVSMYYAVFGYTKNDISGSQTFSVSLSFHMKVLLFSPHLPEILCITWPHFFLKSTLLLRIIVHLFPARLSLETSAEIMITNCWDTTVCLGWAKVKTTKPPTACEVALHIVSLQQMCVDKGHCMKYKVDAYLYAHPITGNSFTQLWFEGLSGVLSVKLCITQMMHSSKLSVWCDWKN